MRVSSANKKPSIADYYPSPDQWERIDPNDAGFDPRKLAESLVFAAENETDFPTDLRKKIPTGKRHPFDRQLGPIKDRSAPSGVILKGGYLLGQFGPIDSIEVTFSVTKSYISAAAGLAYDDGLMDGSEVLLDADPCNADSDNDGLADGLEFGLAAAQGLHTDATLFVADSDPSATTNPLLVDTDGGTA